MMSSPLLFSVLAPLLCPESRDGKNSSWNGSLSLTEYKIYKSDGLADASTQTEENVSRPKSRETCTRGVSTDDNSSEHEYNNNYQNGVPCVKEKSDIMKDHSFGLVPTYRPRFSHSKFASPLFSTSISLGELDCLSENPRLMGYDWKIRNISVGASLRQKCSRKKEMD
ncbi:hypothetical protein GH714_015132 [Hevea brasiliensis]|uniref:Uncharacterized protein n=1 Tax=Hevea brasiliensis TaxID=3981 RepID=A0A6A6LGV0_HEVBR|nr:hypothetical protein GH714_015132 [Hevea brasiliensis]